MKLACCWNALREVWSRRSNMLILNALSVDQLLDGCLCHVTENVGRLSNACCRSSPSPSVFSVPFIFTEVQILSSHLSHSIPPPSLSIFAFHLLSLFPIRPDFNSVFPQIDSVFLSNPQNSLGARARISIVLIFLTLFFISCCHSIYISCFWALRGYWVILSRASL